MDEANKLWLLKGINIVGIILFHMLQFYMHNIDNHVVLHLSNTGMYWVTILVICYYNTYLVVYRL